MRLHLYLPSFATQAPPAAPTEGTPNPPTLAAEPGRK